MDRQTLRKSNIILLLLIVGIVVSAIYISTRFFYRFDLTQEKRYTLSPVSKQVLRDLDQVVFVKVYLHGDLPVKFKRLSNSIHEMLDEFRIYAGSNIEYQFVDPYADNSNEKTNEFIKELNKKGLQPTNIEIKDAKGGVSQKLLVPGALAICNGIEIPVNLLVNLASVSGEENLNKSIQALEYKLISTIWNISRSEIDKIAFIEGQGELNDYSTADITKELSNFYQVDRGVINGNVDALRNYKALIIAKPQYPFSEFDKYALDQYLMDGGKILWLIDAVKADLDSMPNGTTLASISELNLDDQLFRYGIRIYPSLLQDVQCAMLPVNISLKQSEPKFVSAPWLYSPLLMPANNNPIARNTGMVRADFCSYIDTIQSPGLQKTILLATSQYTKIVKVPVLISLDEVKKQPTQQEFNTSHLPVAVLVEGKFQSVFKNRMTQQLQVKNSKPFVEEGIESKMVVVSDGDIIKNAVRMSTKGVQVIPLGVDKYTGQLYGNKEFIVNTINYLTDDKGLLNLRNREVKMRILSKSEILYNKTKWQVVNIAVPILLVLIMGVWYNRYRVKRYVK